MCASSRSGEREARIMLDQECGANEDLCERGGDTSQTIQARYLRPS
jgi:hypothetical protein